MISEHLPMVLRPPLPLSSISMERALNQIKGILENSWKDSATVAELDRIEASIDDVDVMLQCIAR